jgi:hypothetical protein
MPTTVSAPLPDLDLEGSSVIVVDTGDTDAIITRMVVHFTQDVPEEAVKVTPAQPLFAYGPTAGAEAPGLTP